ncbi:CaiB/BaiF CoA transferase family protein [Ancylobacter mangrovi]|uniref:CaiB/BaiF CoA transferase family protein n=1 Tax=Ancylobacter mangrovi TaxID=2972472 RepID=UPI002162D5C4|nr:CoA transferase [Ancylobacter mangrovi]MCS0502075.1 CoA transferase [Ancylobacter mangrovi]
MAGSKPLAGIRVLDFSRVLAGPFCTALLADVGAEVIKVEPPQGDDYRHIGPFVGGEGGLFLLMNRNKRSMALDLKQEEARELAHELIAKSDVIVENFRPGVADRLGIGFEQAKAINPGIVYLSISGFGQEGPLAKRPSYDIVAQAMAGMMSMTGDPEGPPTRVGDALGDLSSGLYGAWAVAVALVGRLRSGEGRRIDVAMFDSIFSLLPTPMSLMLFAGASPTRTGNHHAISTPFGSFAARDGQVIIAVANNALFARLAAAMGQPELAYDPRFATDSSRTEHAEVLRPAVEAWTRARSVEEVVAILDREGIPVSPIWSVEQAAASAHVTFRRLFAEVDHPAAGTVRVMEQPVQFYDVPRGQVTPAPLLGEHTDAILEEVLGIPAERREELRRAGII